MSTHHLFSSNTVYMFRPEYSDCCNVPVNATITKCEGRRVVKRETISIIKARRVWRALRAKGALTRVEHAKACPALYAD